MVVPSAARPRAGWRPNPQARSHSRKGHAAGRKNHPYPALGRRQRRHQQAARQAAQADGRGHHAQDYLIVARARQDQRRHHGAVARHAGQQVDEGENRIMRSRTPWLLRKAKPLAAATPGKPSRSDTAG